MKANELRIGNWYNWYADGKYYQYQVEPKDFVMGNMPNYEGVPLTEEILLKCGFAFCDMVYSFNGFEILDLKQGLEFFNHDYPIKLEYLHQLQNLYFALTGEELTVNL